MNVAEMTLPVQAGPSEAEIERAAAQLSEAMKRNLRALPSQSGVWMTVAEMRGNGATGAGMDILYVYHHRDKLCERRWTRWGSEQGQKRGEGYEYSILPLGLAVRAHLQGEG
jgi:hypothetical protein